MTSNEGARFDQNGQRNKRGRYILGNDRFIVSSDDSLGAVLEASRLNAEKEDDDKEMKTPDPLSFGRTRKRGKPRGQKKGFYPKKPRAGRPLIGAERRVKMNTSIARCTLEMLRQHEVTLAKVLTVSARRLMAHGW